MWSEKKCGSRDLEDVQIARTSNIIVNMPKDRQKNENTFSAKRNKKNE